MCENLIQLDNKTTALGIPRGSVNYTFTSDFNRDKAIELIDEFVALAKSKDLTIRQAQQLFLVCADAVMDSRLK
jgi:hypothetical protein